MKKETLETFWDSYSGVMSVYLACAQKTGLTELQIAVLDIVSRTPGCTQKRLSDLTRLPKQRINLIVRQFVEDGILTLRREEADGRSKTVLFTPEGQRYAEGFLPEMQRAALYKLSGEEEHTHTLADGSVITHAHHHAHPHVHQNTKAVLDRLAKATGHLEKVRSMVADGVDCSEVLIQLAAVKSAINNTGKIILKDHIEHCLVDAIECGDTSTLTELQKAIDQFIK